MEHFFQLTPKTFPKDEGALMQVAWYLAVCDDRIAEAINKTAAMGKTAPAAPTENKPA